MRFPSLLFLASMLALVVRIQVEQAMVPPYSASAPCIREQGASLLVPTAVSRLRGGASVDWDELALPSHYDPDL